ncbi:MAG: glycosyltransferase N-terminal domain-containing protein [Candidatus Eisenbacteria bacterium]
MYTYYRIMTNLLWPLAVSASALRRATGSREWGQRVGRTPPVAEGAVWLHAASVGEVAAVTPLATALATTPAGVFLTVVTPTGRAVAARSLSDLAVSFAPLDFVTAVRRVLRSVRPRALLLTETELWPNTIYESAEAGVPVGMVNGRLSERSLRRYVMLGSPLRSVASRVSFAACRSEADALRFRELGIAGSRVTVVGDMKFDKLEVPLSETERVELRSSLGIPGDARVVVFGSVRPKEESAVASAVAAVADEFPKSYAVVAPRHLERVPRVVEALASRGVGSTLRSSRGGDGPAHRTIVVDTTGELARIYAAGSVAFVGGTLAPYGGHDPLEPAAQGVPVVLGPHTETCSGSARRLLSEGAAFEVGGSDELAQTLLDLLRDDDARAEAGARALRAVASGRGATARTVEFLESIGVLDAASG